MNPPKNTWLIALWIWSIYWWCCRKFNHEKDLYGFRRLSKWWRSAFLNMGETIRPTWKTKHDYFPYAVCNLRCRWWEKKLFTTSSPSKSTHVRLFRLLRYHH